ncbi:MAG: 4Fe-4S dicluster domain-containing protein [Planctomycetota bacterium]|jgi:heterodisulfide reductase subunit A
MAEKKKTALFLCQCGNNVADFIDLDAVKAWAENEEGVELVEIEKLLCAPVGKDFFKEKIKGLDVDSIVVAACSPKMHEKTFQTLAEEVGINMSRVVMANIREQCGWVTKDRTEATEKAKKLIRAAVKRSVIYEDLVQQKMEVLTDVLVVGGGIAGVEAALTAARAGRKVTIVEKEISLGGAVIKTEEIAPNMECSPCLLAPELAEVNDNPDINVITNAELLEVKGFYGNFEATILKKARFIEDSCIGCETCFEVCPVEVKSDFLMGLGNRKAVYTLFPGSVPAAAVIDKENCRHFNNGSCTECEKVCPFKSVNFEQQDEEIDLKFGAIVIATGYGLNSGERLKELGYGEIDNVYTLAEFERIASSNGPYGGDIKLKNGEKPETVAVIYSSAAENKPTSPVLFTAGIKVADYIYKQIPQAKVYNIFSDLTVTNSKTEEFMHEQQEKGAVYLKCPDMTTVRTRAKGHLIVVKGKKIPKVKADMVIVINEMTAAAGTEQLAEMLTVDLGADGFYKSGHDLIGQTRATLDGIYLAGCAAGPCDVAESVTRSQAAVGDILSKLVPGREIDLEIMTAEIDSEKCGGCKMCIVTCPYNAISFDEEENISKVNEAICRGCGTCVATCASGSAKARHFTDEQIYAEIGGLLNG